MLRLDRVGYVPGEDINLDAELVNLSRKDVSASYVTMQQVVNLDASLLYLLCHKGALASVYIL